MGKVIVAQFVSLDGVTEDPDGSGGTPYGGWAFRNPAAVAGDKFRLGPVLDTGVMLLGRTTPGSCSPGSSPAAPTTSPGS